MRERNTGINIRVTDSEKKTITENAMKCNLTVSEYLRKLAMGHEPKELPKAEIYEEILDLDHAVIQLLDEAIPKDDEMLRKKYRSEIREIRNSLNRIWNLLRSNFDKKQKGRTANGNH